VVAFPAFFRLKLPRPDFSGHICEFSFECAYGLVFWFKEHFLVGSQKPVAHNRFAAVDLVNRY
jgi:hypothetical protein